MSGSLANLHVEFLLRVGRFRDLDVGLQLQLLVLHLHGHHAIETDGQVVVGVVRLYQRHIDVCIRNHLFRSGDFHLAFLAEVVHHHGLQHAVVGFHRDECLSLVVGREGHHDFLAHLIAFGRGLHRQLCGSTRCRGGVAPTPVEVDDLGEGMTAFLVTNDEEIASPLFLRDVERHRSRALAGQIARLHRSLVSARGIALQRIVIFARPPPPVIQLVECIIQGDCRLIGRTVFVDHGDIELPVLVRVVVSAVFRQRLRQIHTHITRIGRKLGSERGNAEIAALFEDLHRESAVHHIL